MRKVRLNLEERRILELCDMFGITYARINNECEINFGKIEVKDESVDKTTIHPFAILYDQSDNSLFANSSGIRETADQDPNKPIDNPYEKATARIVERIYDVLTESYQCEFWDKLMDDFEDRTNIDIYFLISFSYIITKFGKSNSVLVDNKKREDRAVVNTMFALLQVQGVVDSVKGSAIETLKTISNPCTSIPETVMVDYAANETDETYDYTTPVME